MFQGMEYPRHSPRGSYSAKLVIIFSTKVELSTPDQVVFAAYLLPPAA